MGWVILYRMSPDVWYEREVDALIFLEGKEHDWTLAFMPVPDGLTKGSPHDVDGGGA